MTTETLDQACERLRPYVERAKGFSGWSDFPANRAVSLLQPWDYVERARELVSNAQRVLDIGTGGGERLFEILEGSGRQCVATEEWAPNVPVAAAHLGPLRVEVVHCQDERLPFSACSFDLVLNRHSAMTPGEVVDLLRPGGSLLSQQVGNDNWYDIRPFLPRKTDFGDHFHTYREGLEAGGLNILRHQRHEARVAYDSVGDFVYMLCVAPWEVPDFDPLGADLKAVLAMERALSTSVGFVVTDTRYIIEALKPA